MSGRLCCYKQQQHSKLLAQFVFKESAFCVLTTSSIFLFHSSLEHERFLLNGMHYINYVLLYFSRNDKYLSI